MTFLLCFEDGTFHLLCLILALICFFYVLSGCKIRLYVLIQAFVTIMCIMSILKLPVELHLLA